MPSRSCLVRRGEARHRGEGCQVVKISSAPSGDHVQGWVQLEAHRAPLGPDPKLQIKSRPETGEDFSSGADTPSDPQSDGVKSPGNRFKGFSNFVFPTSWSRCLQKQFLCARAEALVPARRSPFSLRSLVISP